MKNITVDVMGATYNLEVDDEDPDDLQIATVIDANEDELDPEDFAEGLTEEDWDAISAALAEEPTGDISDKEAPEEPDPEAA